MFPAVLRIGACMYGNKAFLFGADDAVAAYVLFAFLETHGETLVVFMCVTGKKG